MGILGIPLGILEEIPGILAGIVPGLPQARGRSHEEHRLQPHPHPHPHLPPAPGAPRTPGITRIPRICRDPRARARRRKEALGARRKCGVAAIAQIWGFCTQSCERGAGKRGREGIPGRLGISGGGREAATPKSAPGPQNLPQNTSNLPPLPNQIRSAPRSPNLSPFSPLDLKICPKFPQICPKLPRPPRGALWDSSSARGRSSTPRAEEGAGSGSRWPIRAQEGGEGAANESGGTGEDPARLGRPRRRLKNSGTGGTTGIRRRDPPQGSLTGIAHRDPSPDPPPGSPSGAAPRSPPASGTAAGSPGRGLPERRRAAMAAPLAAAMLDPGGISVPKFPNSRGSRADPSR
ncbi:collagen alpha-1(X) chain-like [Passer montanus]|uniref:collagen alpha-1(X) chain-like n=1 Tax=Passer montanus TaxID=9160 RepID=UPI001961446E|nr:collagen alpha-1(X) chain-like [Passer montanus]